LSYHLAFVVHAHSQYSVVVALKVPLCMSYSGVASHDGDPGGGDGEWTKAEEGIDAEGMAPVSLALHSQDAEAVNDVNDNLGAPPNVTALRPSWLSPFGYKGYRFLFLANVAEFTGRTLAEIATLVWLYEATNNALALGWLGIVTLCVQVPTIPLGGVLADELDRRKLIATMLGTNAVVIAIVGVLCLTNRMQIFMAYVSVGMVQLTSQLENSARSALTASVVPRSVLPRAVSANVVTDNAGKVLAPILFFAIAGGAHASKGSLSVAFIVAAVSYAVAAVSPLMIAIPQEEGEDALGEDEGISLEANGAEREQNAGNSHQQPATVRGTLRSRYLSLIEGVRYILGHPLLPGLYALDWGMTVVSFYRELFPLFVAELFTKGRSELGLSERGAVALLTSVNFLGAVVGGVMTFAVQDCNKYYGRQVMIATLAYAAGCLLFGATNLFLVGIIAVFWCGACDAVGAAMRNIVVLITTPDKMRGRARSGHYLAANVANSLGQLYVAAMANWIGPGYTMMLGGVVTVCAVSLAVLRIPALWTKHADNIVSTTQIAESGDDAKDAREDEIAMMRQDHDANSSFDATGKETLGMEIGNAQPQHGLHLVNSQEASLQQDNSSAFAIEDEEDEEVGGENAW